ncbi:hypothetical protein Tco_0077174 [Tanacetum coccineum]
MRRVNTFIPIESEVNKSIHELAPRSSKRDAEEELNQGSSKRQKTGESSKTYLLCLYITIPRYFPMLPKLKDYGETALFHLDKKSSKALPLP